MLLHTVYVVMYIIYKGLFQLPSFRGGMLGNHSNIVDLEILTRSKDQFALGAGITVKEYEQACGFPDDQIFNTITVGVRLLEIRTKSPFAQWRVSLKYDAPGTKYGEGLYNVTEFEDENLVINQPMWIVVGLNEMRTKSFIFNGI